MGYTARNFRGYLSGLGNVTAVDVTATDDLAVTDDAVISDDLDVVGDLTAGTIVSDAGVTATTLLTGAGVTNSGLEIQSSLVSPSALSAGETTLWSPTAARHIRATGTTASFVCSMAAGSASERRTIENIGTVAITFGHEETSATAANRFTCPGGIPFVLWAKESVDVWYSSTTSRWLVLGQGRFAPDGVVFPRTPADFLAQTGYSAAFLAICDDKSGALRDSSTAGNLTAAGSPTYDYRVDGRRGLFLDADADYFSAAVLEPGTASMATACLFMATAHTAANRQIIGKNALVTEPLHHALLVAADDKVYVKADDGAGHAFQTAAIGGAAISFGVPYLLTYQLDKAAVLLRTRMVNLNTLAVTTAADLAITDLATLTGGTSPVFSIGFWSGVLWGGGLWYGGAAVMTGSGIEGASVLTNLTTRLVGA